MTSGNIDVRLAALDNEHVAEICRLLQIDSATVQGYLAEEVFGWSVSRIVLQDAGDDSSDNARVIGLIQVTKLNPEQGYGLLGTWLVPDVWGTGVNQAAKQLIMREMCEIYPEIERVYLCIAHTNIRSVMAARKLSFIQEISERNVPAELLPDGASAVSNNNYWFVMRQDAGTEHL